VSQKCLPDLHAASGIVVARSTRSLGYLWGLPGKMNIWRNSTHAAMAGTGFLRTPGNMPLECGNSYCRGGPTKFSSSGFIDTQDTSPTTLSFDMSVLFFEERHGLSKEFLDEKCLPTLASVTVSLMLKRGRTRNRRTGLPNTCSSIARGTPPLFYLKHHARTWLLAAAGS
jgi:hypothetical protein